MKREERKKENKYVFVFLIAACTLLSVLGCPDDFTSPEILDNTNNDANGVFVRIYIGENNTSARTIQPGRILLPDTD